MRVAAMIAGWVLAGVAFADDAPGAAAGGGDRYSGPGFATRAPVLARHGMAATAQPLATMIAVEILKKGGSAVDAAICRTRFDGAGQLRDRRPFAIVCRPEALRLQRSGRSPMGHSLADLRRSRRSRHVPPSLVAGNGAGRGRRWFVARTLRLPESITCLLNTRVKGFGQ
jgi:gamma-glutamyltranspeptidase/glutathione hydrolase